MQLYGTAEIWHCLLRKGHGTIGTARLQSICQVGATAGPIQLCTLWRDGDICKEQRLVVSPCACACNGDNASGDHEQSCCNNSNLAQGCVACSTKKGPNGKYDAKRWHKQKALAHGGANWEHHI